MEWMFLLTFLISVLSLIAVGFMKESLIRRYYKLKKGVDIGGFFDSTMNLTKNFQRIRVIFLFPVIFPVRLSDDTVELINLRKRIRLINILLLLLIIFSIALGIYSKIKWPEGFTIGN